jgi:glycosyltransferase involved in cell wall biosynthesis
VLTNAENSTAREAIAAESSRPSASVVMTAYGDLRFLEPAVDSILRQEFSDLELVLVDDGTGQDAIFHALAAGDPRIRIVVNPTNLGGPGAANRGIDIARSDIIVRMDADDIAEPTRVGRLMAELADDPQLGLVGSAVTLMDEAGLPLRVAIMPETDLEIRWTILFHCPFYHPAVAFRRSCFELAGRYIDSKLVSYDHYLWFHMLPFCRARNLADPLLQYRENPQGLTATHLMKNPRGRTHMIREALWARLGLTYDLYDDPRARNISQFVRGFDITAPESRAVAYRSILTVLRAFLAQPLAAVEDVKVARRMGHDIVRRILANPPDDLREMLAICRLCWPIDRLAAYKAGQARLAGELKMRWQSARTRSTRSRAN